MPVRFKPTSVIIARLGLEPNGPVQTYFTKRCADYMDNFVPLDEGNLAYTNRIVEKDKVIYNSPYAHYMYEGKVMVDPVTGSAWARKDAIKVYNGADIDYSKSWARGHTEAGPHWDKRMWSVHKEDIIKEVQKYFKRQGG